MDTLLVIVAIVITSRIGWLIGELMASKNE